MTYNNNDSPIYSMLSGKFPSSYTVSNSIYPEFEGVYTLQGIKSVGSSYYNQPDVHPYYKSNTTTTWGQYIWIFYEVGGLQWVAAPANSWESILNEFADGIGSFPGQEQNGGDCPPCPTIPLTGWIFDISETA